MFVPIQFLRETKKIVLEKSIVEKLNSYGVETSHYEIIPDEFDVIQEKTKAFAKEHQLVIFTGGTGLSPRDVTPEAFRHYWKAEFRELRKQSAIMDNKECRTQCYQEPLQEL